MLAFWVCAAVTALSAFVSCGFAVAALMKAKNEPLRLSAWYASTRSGALAMASVGPVVNHSQGWLVAVATAMILVQVGDAAVGTLQRNVAKTLVPAALAALNAAALVWMAL